MPVISNRAGLSSYSTKQRQRSDTNAICPHSCNAKFRDILRMLTNVSQEQLSYLYDLCSHITGHISVVFGKRIDTYYVSILNQQNSTSIGNIFCHSHEKFVNFHLKIIYMVIQHMRFFYRSQKIISAIC